MGDTDVDEADGQLGPADGANDDRPPPGPFPREVRRPWAEEGNVEAFLELIHGKPWCLFSIHEQMRNLLRACEARAVKDPAAFTGEVFDRMAGFPAFLVLRAQLVVEEHAVGRDDLRSPPRSRTSRTTWPSGSCHARRSFRRHGRDPHRTGPGRPAVAAGQGQGIESRRADRGVSRRSRAPVGKTP